MAAPLMVSFTLRFLFVFVDLAYAAVLDDDNAAVAAIGFYAPLQSIHIALWVGLSAGFTASLSRAFGHRDEVRVAQLKRSMLTLLTMVIPLLMLVGAGVYLLVPHLGLEPRLSEAFLIYASTVAIGGPIIGFWSIYPDSIVKAHQDTRSTMIAGLASAFTNVALNTLFVFGFGWGIFGIALATVISRIAGLWYAMHRAGILEAGRRAAGWGSSEQVWPAPMSTMLMLALPGALTHLLMAVEGGVINKVLTGLPHSTAAIASYAVYQQLLMLAMMPAAGASVAVVPYVARAMATGEAARIRRELAGTVRLVLAIALGVTICSGWVFAEPISGFFVDRQSLGDSTSMTMNAMRLLPLAALATAPFYILRPIFEATHKPRMGIEISIARFVVLSVPLILAGRHLAPAVGLDGLSGVILGIVTATGLASSLAAYRAREALRTTP